MNEVVYQENMRIIETRRTVNPDDKQKGIGS